MFRVTESRNFPSGDRVIWNRCYCQHYEVMLIRRIRELLYDYSFAINGVRNHLVLGFRVRLRIIT